MMNEVSNILPGDRVMVFDPRLFIDNILTPLYHTVRSAIVTKRYGYTSEYMEEEYGIAAAIYPDCVDVIFDYDNFESKGHFTSSVELVH